MEKLYNSSLSVCVSSHGAELQSIIKGGTEYLWNGDSHYWGRRSPILFPIVGSVWDKKMKFNGKVFEIGQHGFARDMDFELIAKDDDFLTYRLRSNEKTHLLYPYNFTFDITYRLIGNRLEVIWDVLNDGADDMYFQIGAHPGFKLPDFNPDAPCHGYFSLSKNGLSVPEVSYILIGQKGCADVENKYKILQAARNLPIDVHTFDRDAFIIEGSQLDKITLHDRNGRPWVSVHFTSPLVGLWSPPRKNAPFICIEPWYGRCDRVGFDGEFKDRDYVNCLKSGDRFKSKYTIEIH